MTNSWNMGKLIKQLRAESLKLSVALVVVADLEGRGSWVGHPGLAAGAARGCAGRGRRRAEIRAGLG